MGYDACIKVVPH